MASAQNKRLRNIWKCMRKRCNYTKNINYKYYGGRGIKTCSEWNSFKPFKEWALSNGYADSLTIDRIDGEGNYYPENCRWVDMKQQNRNKKSNPTYEYKGVKKSVIEWAEICGIKPSTVYARLYSGWPIQKALQRREDS